MAQTAVEWLRKNLKDFPHIKHSQHFKDLIEQAKQMEKEQISKSWDDGNYAYFYSKETGVDFDNGEQYYNETYNK